MLLFKIDFKNRHDFLWLKDIIVDVLKPKYKHNGYTALYNDKDFTYNEKGDRFKETYEDFYRIGRYNNVFYFHLFRDNKETK